MNYLSFVNKRFMSNKYKFTTICVYYALMYIATLAIWQYFYGENNIIRTIFYALIPIGTISFFIRAKFQDGAIYIKFFTYYLFIIASGLLADNKAGLILSVYQYIFLSLSFFAAAYALERVKVINVLKFIVFMSVVISLLAVYERLTSVLILGSTSLGYFFNGEIIYRARVFADSPLALGTLLGIFLLISFFMFELSKRKIYLCILVINMMGLMSTSSRGPLVATIVGVIILKVLYNYTITKPNIKRKQKNIVISITILLSIFIFYLITGAYIENNAIIDRISSIFNWTEYEGNSMRIYKWQLYFDVFIENWFTGIGVGGVNLTNYGVTESGVLKVLAELGIFGFIAYYFIIYSILIRGFLKVKNLRDENKKIVVLGISLVFLVLVEDAILQILESTIIGFCFWSSLAMIYIGCQNRKTFKMDEKEN